MGGRVDKKFDQFKQDLVGKDKRSFDYTKRCWFQLIVSTSGEGTLVAIINPAETADDQYINSKDALSPLIDLLLVQNCPYSADAQQSIKSDLKSSKRAALHEKATSLPESLPEGLRLVVN